MGPMAREKGQLGRRPVQGERQFISRENIGLPYTGLCQKKTGLTKAGGSYPNRTETLPGDPRFFVGACFGRQGNRARDRIAIRRAESSGTTRTCRYVQFSQEFLAFHRASQRPFFFFSLFSFHPTNLQSVTRACTAAYSLKTWSGPFRRHFRSSRKYRCLGATLQKQAAKTPSTVAGCLEVPLIATIRHPRGGLR